MFTVSISFGVIIGIIVQQHLPENQAGCPHTLSSLSITLDTIHQDNISILNIYVPNTRVFTIINKQSKNKTTNMYNKYTLIKHVLFYKQIVK